MASHEHLPLQRIEGELVRRKRLGFPAEKRSAKEHGVKVGREMLDVVQDHKKLPPIADIDPALILKIETTGAIDEDTWARLGLTVLAIEPNKTVVLFANDVELTEFRRRVEAYGGKIPEGQKGAPYAQIFDAIESIGQLSPADRIGPVLRREGVVAVDTFPEGVQTMDVELWPVSDVVALLFIQRVTTILEDNGGEVVSEYRGSSVLLMRVSGPSQAIRALFDLPEVASIDRSPEPDWPELAIEEFTLGSIPDQAPAEEGAQIVGIIDSGLTSSHPLLSGSVIASFGEPATLGDDDAKGHGTSVSGIAAFGDIRQKLAKDPMQPAFRIASAKVVNADGKFDRAELVPTQMERAIRRLHFEFGCRVVNISLADFNRPAALKLSSWAATLDNLARELDIVIVLATGNADRARLAKLGDGIAVDYPNFLLDEANRILEPASAINAVAVGSIAHANGLAISDAENVGVMPISDAFQPSPFTRIGPGANGAIKPDLVDFGGTAVFDGPTQRLQDGSRRASAGVLSLYSEYLVQLLAARSGTSFSAPLVAHKAAMLFDAFPGATSNLVRSLLALGAEHPPSALQLLQGKGDDAVFNLLGYGMTDINRALASDDNRVVLFREDSLATDHFAVYEVPIPEEFRMGRGRRHIKVSLAFDPPVRHTRVDCAGTKMGFHLLRGVTAEEVFDAYRKWEKDEGDPARLTGRFRCSMEPGIQRRERGTLQCSSFVAQRGLEKYGESYFLAVRCESGWSSDDQRFAVAVELQHEVDIQLYQRIRERIRVRV
ncbi:MAG: S8 family peptidase [Bradyrhizobium sp.]